MVFLLVVYILLRGWMQPPQVYRPTQLAPYCFVRVSLSPVLWKRWWESTPHPYPRQFQSKGWSLHSPPAKTLNFSFQHRQNKEIKFSEQDRLLPESHPHYFQSRAGKVIAGSSPQLNILPGKVIWNSPMLDHLGLCTSTTAAWIVPRGKSQGRSFNAGVISSHWFVPVSSQRLN